MKRLERKLLKELYQQSKGSPSHDVNWEAAGEKFDLTRKQTLEIIHSLMRDGLIKGVTHESVSLTPQGINKVVWVSPLLKKIIAIAISLSAFLWTMIQIIDYFLTRR